MNTNVHFSKKSDLWETPQDLFDRLNDIFNFDADVCATKNNTKLPVYISPDKNGLTARWSDYGQMCWMNPPYSRIFDWIKKAYSEHLTDHISVVCLVPARTDTRWFQDYCSKGNIIFLRGRLKFGNNENSAPFPSCLVMFGSMPPEFSLSELNIERAVNVYFQPI